MGFAFVETCWLSNVKGITRILGDVFLVNNFYFRSIGQINTQFQEDLSQESLCYHARLTSNSLKHTKDCLGEWVKFLSKSKSHYWHYWKRLPDNNVVLRHLKIVFHFHNSIISDLRWRTLSQLYLLSFGDVSGWKVKRGSRIHLWSR